MQLSEHWLRTFVDPDLSTDELAHELTMRGLEIEDVRPVAPAFTGIVVGEVIEVTRHPNADRLNVCRVSIDPARPPLNIVCGAPNVAVGIKVPCATVGAVLPPPKDGDAPFEIRQATMRGVASEGMLCSARELKLSDDHAGLLILDAATPVGAPIRDVLDLDDHVFTIKLTPNKGDCLSALGVAREIAALSGEPLVEPSYAAVPATSTEVVPVTIAAPDLCGRFSGRVVRGLNARAATPAWMKDRLARSGQRSVSALVDISNYVMLEVGRPTHVFDLAKIDGGLTVRWARDGETLKLLNGETVTLAADVGVIADQGGDRVESMAGIMGGDATAVSLDTTDVYVEAAFWWPDAVRGRARRYGFSTEAAHRFERGVDATTTVEHLERITRLVLDICGSDTTQVGPIDDHVVALPDRTPVRMRVARADQVIGLPITADDMAAIFTRFGFTFSREGSGADEVFAVTPPPYRFDLEIEEDLIEEVARGYGFEKIPAHLPVARHGMRAEAEERRGVHALADAVADRDYREAINFSFVEDAWERDFAGNAEPIRLLNPIAAPLAVMRSSLIGSLVANVRFNLNRKAARVRVFEIAKVYRRDASVVDGPLSVAGIAQPLKLGAIAWGGAVGDQWGVPSRPVDFFDVKADVESLLAALGPDAAPTFAPFEAGHPALHPGRSARITSRGVEIGFIGELHPRWVQAYELPSAPIVFEIDAVASMQRDLPRVEPVSRFPTVLRDLALIVDAGVPAARVMAVIEEAGTGGDDLVRDVRLFDQYRGKGLNENEKSLAFRFRLQDTRQTLDEAAIEAAMTRIVTVLGERLGARLRS